MDEEYYTYRYDCNHTLTDETTRIYKIECKPHYSNSRPIFSVPKRREDATIECIAPFDSQAYLTEYSVTWAVPCNNIQECYDGEDENGCEFPFWIIPSISFGTGIVLCLAFATYLYKYSHQDWNEIMQDRRWRLATQQSTSKESEKAYKIALMVHGENLAGIKNIFRTEVETHGSEATAICYLKVTVFVVFSKTKACVKLKFFLCSRNTTFIKQ